MVWHGSDSGGIRDKSAYCEAWHSDTPSNIGLGSDLLKGQLLGQENLGCNNKLVVLCIEVASQHNYRRKRSSSDDESASKFDANHSFQNLTFEHYSQFLDEYDEIDSSSKSENSA
jgi:hypothetical protein